MIVLLSSSHTTGPCDECNGSYVYAESYIRPPYNFKIKIGNKDSITLCLKCYRKLSDILVFDFDYREKTNKDMEATR